MKRKENKYIVGILAILIFLLSLLYIFINDNRKLTLLESGIKDLTLSTFKIVKFPIDFITDKKEEFKNQKEIRKKYVQLKKTNEKLKLENKKNQELVNELNNLKKSLDLNNSLTDYDIINSSVISRDVGYWYDTLTIDKGKNKNVVNDMAVITNQGLVGKIIKTTASTSTVKLLTSITEDTKISVKILDNDKAIYGLLTSFNEKKKTFIVEGIAENISIEKGLEVSTTGMDNIFPSGILIGKVVSTSKDNFDLAIFVEVKSDVDFDDLRYVMVAKRRDIS